MSVSLTNRDDIAADSISLIQQAGLYDLGTNVLEVVATLPQKIGKGTVCTTAETYNKPEVNALLSNLSDATVAEQLVLKANIDDVNQALALKADKANTYTKVAVDTLLAPKASSSDVTAYLSLKADKSDTFTKVEITDVLDTKADDDEVLAALILIMNII